MSGDTEFATIQVSRDGNVLTMTLNRPDVLNALNDDMAAEILQVLRGAERDPEVRCIVITGAGRGFCAGQDLKSVADETGTRSLGKHLDKTWNAIVRRIRRIEKPVLAAVNGVAAGAGASLALACDMRIASENARFIQSFIGVGLIPDSGSTFFLPRTVGMGRALELAFTGRPVDAGEADSLGLVNRVVPQDELMDETMDLARRLASAPTRAIGMTKRAMNRAMTSDFEDALQYEAYLQEAAGKTYDHGEGVKAFIEKRPPKFEGR